MGILNPKKKEKKQVEAPKWFMVMMVGFVLYAILHSIFSDDVTAISKESRQAEQTQSVNRFLFTPLLSKREGGRDLPMTTRDRGAGVGPLAGCWEEVEVSYRLFDRQNKLVEERTALDDPLHFIIGAGTVPPALERGVLGMQESGRREITARGDMAFGAEGFSHPQLGERDLVAYDVTLQKINRPGTLPATDLGLRVYDDVVGKGRIAQCTDSVRIRVKGWNATGAALWPEADASQEIAVHIGKGEAPYAIERALLGMQSEGRRTLIVAPGYGHSIYASAEEAETAFVWQGREVPQREVILLELELLPEAETVPDAFDQKPASVPAVSVPKPQENSISSDITSPTEPSQE